MSRIKIVDSKQRSIDNCSVQQLQKITVSSSSPQDCAAEILEAVLVAMRFIRSQMRRHRGSDLTVPQFRTLVFLDRTPGASLSALADFLALSLPATSRLVEGLVRRSLVDRRIPSGNRRLVALSVNARGRKIICAARQATEKRLAEVVAPLRGDERAAIQRALRTLREEFQSMATRD